jgi:hypothetical protein
MSTPPTIPALPTAPQPGDTNDVWEDRAVAWSNALPGQIAAENALAVWMNTTASATASASSSAASNANASSQSAAAAAVSAAAAAATSTAANWVSGTTYAVGNVRRSLIDGLPYLRTTAGAGTTDPRNDPENWVLDFLQIDTGLPNIRPTLLLDPVNSGVVDPRIVTTRASTATYWDEFGLLRTAPANTLRIDHDPFTGERLGYLVEGPGTNLCTSPQDIMGSGWYGALLAPLVAAPNPFGVSHVNESSPSSAGVRIYTIDAPDAGTELCLSHRFKPSDDTAEQVIYADGNGIPTAVASVSFIPATGVVTSLTGGAKNFFLQRLSDGWYLASMSITSTGTGVIGHYAHPTTTSMQWYGFQAETGVIHPTSLILAPDGLRAADVPVISGTAFSDFYNQNEGTWAFEVNKKSTTTGNDFLLEFSSTDAQNRVLLYSNPDYSVILYVIAGGALFSVSAYTLSASDELNIRVTMTYRPDECLLSVNGRSSQQFTLPSFTSPMSRVFISKDGGTSGSIRHRNIAYYPRAVTAAQLQALSRL